MRPGKYIASPNGRFGRRKSYLFYGYRWPFARGDKTRSLARSPGRREHPAHAIPRRSPIRSSRELLRLLLPRGLENARGRCGCADDAASASGDHLSRDVEPTSSREHQESIRRSKFFSFFLFFFLRRGRADSSRALVDTRDAAFAQNGENEVNKCASAHLTRSLSHPASCLAVFVHLVSSVSASLNRSRNFNNVRSFGWPITAAADAS